MTLQAMLGQDGPNVIIEAMAFSKPVISTRHAGIPEAINSILVDENNVEQLVSALRISCDSAELRQTLGNENRIIAERMFSSANNKDLERILMQNSRDSLCETDHVLGQPKSRKTVLPY